VILATILAAFAALALSLAMPAAAAAAEPAASRDAGWPTTLAGGDAARPAGATGAAADSILFAVRIVDNNQLGIAISNYGFIGNSFSARSPSLEYPLGSAFEHLVRGGIWIGARALDDQGAFTGVTTGALDAVNGASAQQSSEFTPAGNQIVRRSTLLNSPFFNKSAVSEQDNLGSFSDHPAKTSVGNAEPHRPISVLVRQDNYSWSFSQFQHSVVFKYVITNIGPPLANVWVGIYAELASGDRAEYTGWPPGVNWFRKKTTAYDDSLRLFREHYCENVPVPGGCNWDHVPYWTGLKLLGTRPEPVATKQITLAAWNWSPGDTLRGTDDLRYQLMSAGTIANLADPSFNPGLQRGDPVAVLAVGPFAQLNPGDTIAVDFAFVGGAEAEDIQDHARFIQRAYDRDYVVPVPPPSPNLKVIARDRAVDLWWDDFAESLADSTGPVPLDFEGYRLYMSEDRNDLRRIAQFDRGDAPHDTAGFNTGFSAVRRDTVIDGHAYQYRYTVNGLRNGFKYFTAITSYDLGNVEIESLESGVSQNKQLAIPGPAAGERPKGSVSVFPNPYRVEALWDRGRTVRDHYLWFTNLPERCTLRIYTLSGDLVYETEFTGGAYRGEGTRGVFDPQAEQDVPPPTLSGTTFAWNMITREGQAAATGLYLYSVEDHAGGGRSLGKFVIVKSDREGLR
jgi:hypothetical protein